MFTGAAAGTRQSASNEVVSWTSCYCSRLACAGLTTHGGVAQDKTLMLDNPVAARPRSAEAAAAQRRRRLRQRPASARTLRALGLVKLPEAERRQAHSRPGLLPCCGHVLPIVFTN